MVKLSELRTEAEIHEQDMHDVDYRREVVAPEIGRAHV